LAAEYFSNVDGIAKTVRHYHNTMAENVKKHHGKGTYLSQ
jgi:hypothetical protein